jgi:exodeoxyribonuclease VII large subunit
MRGNGREVRQDASGAYRIRFPFDRQLVDRIKTLPRRRWNASERYWWVPGEDLAPLVELLAPLGFQFDTATREAYAASGGTLSLEASDSGGDESLSQPGLFDDRPAAADRAEPEDYSVSRLNRSVQAAIAAAFPGEVWLVGEISGYNRNAHKRHVSFQLVEHDAQGKTVSKVDATLFDSARQAIEQELTRAGDPFRLEDEITVRVRARVELYVPWGSYRVVVERLDLHYTLGEAARRREEIVRRLRESGLLDRNRALEFPALPLRVGLITSLGSDAQKDVLRTLEESGFAFRVLCHGARVQGRATEPSVLNALDYLREQAGDLDAVLICRGGGSRTDLAWFDSEALGRAVALFPLPVVIGIGHEQDRSVLDELGWRCKTPTAAAAFLVDRVRGSLEALERSCAAVLGLAVQRLAEERSEHARRGRRLALAARALLRGARQDLGHRRARAGRAAVMHLARRTTLLDGTARALAQAARRELAAARRTVAEAAGSLGPRAARRMAAEQDRTAQRDRRLYLIDPRRVLERGYALLRSDAGAVVTDAGRAPAGTPLRAELRRGTLALRSEGKLETHREDEADVEEG